MQLTVERTGPCQARVAFQVPDEEFQARYRQRLTEAGRQVRLKGFRPGKVPPKVIEQMHGEALRKDVVESFLRDAYEKAVADEGLRPAAHPRVRLEDLEARPGQGLEHTFELDLKPDFELGEIEGLEAEFHAPEVNAQEIEDTLLDIRRRQARPEPAGETGLVEEGMALARIEIVAGGEEVMARDGLRLSLETVPNGVDKQAYQDAVRGAVDGTQVELEITLPDDFERAELRGTKAVCRIAFSQVFRLEIPPEEDLWRAFRAKDQDDLRVRVGAEIERSKIQGERARIENELFQRVLDQHPMELPQTLLESQVESRLATARQQLEEQGLDEDAARAQLDADLDATREAAARSLRAFYLVDRIAQEKKLELSQADLIAEMREIAARNRVSVEEVRDYYQKNDLVRQLSIELLERKVRAFLREHSTATEPQAAAGE